MKQFLENIKTIVFRKIGVWNNLSSNSNNRNFLNVDIMSSAIICGENEIGEYTYIGFNSSVTKSKIGRYCSIAPNVHIGLGEHKVKRVSTSSLFYTNSFDTLTEKECIIGNDVWIGTNAVIRRGVKIGDGAIIGANSFVNKDVNDFEIVAGVPAKHIGMRFSEKIILLIKKSHWWNEDFEKAQYLIKELERTNFFEMDKREYN